MTRRLRLHHGVAAALLSVAAASALFAGGGPAAAAGGGGPAVHGGGAGPLDDDRVHVELTARGDGPTARGRFNIQHHTPDGLFAHLAGDVDCLTVSGKTALVTGTITEGFDDLGIDPVGERVSLLIDDATPDTIALDVSFVSDHTIEPCTAEPILTITLDTGGFRVTG